MHECRGFHRRELDDISNRFAHAFINAGLAKGAKIALLAHPAAYKAPKSVRFVEQVPKSAVGKVLRRALRDPLWQGRERPI